MALTKNCPWRGLGGVQAEVQLSFRGWCPVTLVGAAEWSFVGLESEAFRKSATPRDALSTVGSRVLGYWCRA